MRWPAVCRFGSVTRLWGSASAKLLSSASSALHGATVEHPKLETIQITTPQPNVFHVCFSRPQSKNALNFPLAREIRTVFEYLNTLPECRAVVLSGSNNTFSTGLDLKEALPELLRLSQDKTLDVGRKALGLRSFIAAMQESVTSIEKCEKPVIAAICGYCLGAGISIATAADVRYASNDAIFSIKEVDLGITADVGILNRINRLVGNDNVTREWAFTGRNFTSSEALEHGLILKQLPVEECVDRAIALAAQIAKRSPLAVRGAKMVLNYARDHTVGDSLEYVRMLNHAQLQSEDVMIAAKALLAKTEPQFRDA